MVFVSLGFPPQKMLDVFFTSSPSADVSKAASVMSA